MDSKGFTLIEVLIGLFIAVIASLSVAQVIASTNKVIDAGRKTFIATNLAHEGLELTREIRDDTWFKNSNRAAWASAFCSDNTYTIDPNKAMQDGVYPGDSKKELYIQSNGQWTHDPGTDTGYARLMTIDCKEATNNPAFVTVTSTVSWNGASGQKNVSLTEQLYNWYP
ncbi:MAG: prepilin-type N-terminal cleavage/methylation domain-containing protein [Candidatus Andersenbacteria bacterium]